MSPWEERMSHEHNGHGHHAAAVDFSDAEWATLKAEDHNAGKAIIGLMVGIFLVALVLYTWVLISTAS
jgi:hypothetical protein